MLNEGILSFVLDLIRTEKLYSENIGDLFTRAGILLRGIISGHPFVDGNKRAGFEATDVFLRMNGYYLEVGVQMKEWNLRWVLQRMNWIWTT